MRSKKLTRSLPFFIICFGIIGCLSKEKEDSLFMLLNAPAQGINFINQVEESKELNILKYIYFYNGGGVGAGDFNKDGLVDLYFVGNMVDNALYIQEEHLKFKDITSSAKVKGKANWQTGVNVVDINSDGYDDIYIYSVNGINNFQGRNELYINDARPSNELPTFTEKSVEYGLDLEGYATHGSFFDYDKDGDLDLFMVCHAIHTETSHGPASKKKIRNKFTGDRLLKNENGYFVDISEQAGIYGGENGYGLSVIIFDANQDSWKDIYVCNDFHENDYFYLNNGDGTYTESIKDYFSYTSRFSMGGSFADFNKDGFQDLITLDMLPNEEKVIKESDPGVSYSTSNYLKKLGYYEQFSRNMLQLNKGDGHFHEIGLYAGVEASDWSWTPLTEDFNNDGLIDIFISNGIPKRPNDLDFIKFLSNPNQQKSFDNWADYLKIAPNGYVANQFYSGTPDQTFINQTNFWSNPIPSVSNGAITLDLEGDGDLDIITNNFGSPPFLYINQTDTSNNFLEIELNFDKQNPKGIGATIQLFAEGQIFAKEFNPYAGFLSSSQQIIHFGLGHIKVIDSLFVQWPNGFYQKIEDVSTNQKIVIQYDSIKLFKSNRLHKNPSVCTIETANPSISFQHQEDLYEDFDNQKLLPYKLSNRGGALAIGDINGDKEMDLFIGNGRGFEATFFIQKGGELINFPQPAFFEHKNYEDIDAVLVDFDKDNDLDLLVASGGGWTNCEGELSPVTRLYRNDGAGNFEFVWNSTNDSLFHSSCLVTADVDNDGDIDFFVGKYTTCGKFGKKPTSFLYLNEGNGLNFQKAETPVLDNLGFVTDATWIDLDNNGFEDLVVVGEWESPKIIYNENGTLTKLENLNAKLAGLWQTVTPLDIDNDGDTDFFLGNWGTNNRFQSLNQEKSRMYVGDFDQNGIEEFFFAYSKTDDTFYPMNSKDELDLIFTPFLRSKFPSYQSFAGKRVNQLFSDEVINKNKVYEIQTLQSGLLMNHGEGGLKFQPFDANFQFSPIRSFSILKNKLNAKLSVLMAGNFIGLPPYHGKQTSFSLSMFTVEKGNLDLICELNNIRKQVNKSIVIPSTKKDHLIVLVNDGVVKHFQIE